MLLAFRYSSVGHHCGEILPCTKPLRSALSPTHDVNIVCTAALPPSRVIVLLLQSKLESFILPPPLAHVSAVLNLVLTLTFPTALAPAFGPLSTSAIGRAERDARVKAAPITINLRRRSRLVSPFPLARAGTPIVPLPSSEDSARFTAVGAYPFHASHHQPTFNTALKKPLHHREEVPSKSREKVLRPHALERVKHAVAVRVVQFGEALRDVCCPPIRPLLILGSLLVPIEN